ncbi:DUF86 domain-containing protein [Campylobacter fetus]|uniref:DUF86 domain-containing protein n=3 Tax=Campylobacter fetus TaxID=196 RepID=A0AAE6MAA1_CAMFE|nr:HepT-like ribonuclease domain-containing protein [Campylobacter fetus]ACA64461.1 hypothetical protein [Campylobacter fetus subsp. venerealis NCTC 10354]AHE94551.1 putative protein (DUF86 domain) [Campylobacter fetus subsp. venerealis cfvi03/293]AIR80967.1 hypothetical protein (DUF86 domain) [Campylobacter fetus subsp. venerealis 97/608]EGU24821.1 hypothetical protein CFV354_1928 [Campylobacter fetus subsp. venerealis NCTC 10354]QEL45179.1 DUF86 domain-containing protein [Campylobacter fetus
MSDDVKRLGDISKRINSINKICEKYGGIYEALENFEEAQPAIMMHLIVCNENIDKLMYSDEIDIKSILSQKELRGIKAIRNIAAHDYEGLDFSIIHDVVKYYLPSIKTNIDRFLVSQKEIGGSSGSNVHKVSNDTAKSKEKEK